LFVTDLDPGEYVAHRLFKKRHIRTFFSYCWLRIAGKQCFGRWSRKFWTNLKCFSTAVITNLCIEPRLITTQSHLLRFRTLRF